MRDALLTWVTRNSFPQYRNINKQTGLMIFPSSKHQVPRASEVGETDPRTVCSGQQTSACLLSSSSSPVCKVCFPTSFINKTVTISMTNKAHIGMSPLTHKQEAGSQNEACTERGRKLLLALSATVHSGLGQVN